MPKACPLLYGLWLLAYGAKNISQGRGCSSCSPSHSWIQSPWELLASSSSSIVYRSEAAWGGCPCARCGVCPHLTCRRGDPTLLQQQGFTLNPCEQMGGGFPSLPRPLPLPRRRAVLPAGGGPGAVMAMPLPVRRRAAGPGPLTPAAAAGP